MGAVSPTSIPFPLLAPETAIVDGTSFICLPDSLLVPELAQAEPIARFAITQEPVKVGAYDKFLDAHIGHWALYDRVQKRMVEGFAERPAALIPKAVAAVVQHISVKALGNVRAEIQAREGSLLDNDPLDDIDAATKLYLDLIQGEETSYFTAALNQFLEDRPLVIWGPFVLFEIGPVTGREKLKAEDFLWNATLFQAAAYAMFLGMRLPTNSEFEYAAHLRPFDFNDNAEEWSSDDLVKPNETGGFRLVHPADPLELLGKVPFAFSPASLPKADDWTQLDSGTVYMDKIISEFCDPGLVFAGKSRADALELASKMRQAATPPSLPK